MVARLNLLDEAATDPSVVLIEADKAAGDAPESSAVQAAAGSLFVRRGAFEKGIPALRKAVQLNPRLYAARLELAGALQHEKKMAEAIQEFEALLAVSPPSDVQVLGYVGLGGLLTEAKRWKEAEAALQKGIAIAPDSAILLNNLAWLYVTSDDAAIHNPQKGVQLATKAVELTHQRSASLLDTLAEAYFASGDRDKAVEYGRKALALSPTKEEFKQHLAKYTAK